MSQVLEMQNICKSFYGVEVLHDVNFKLNKGEVRALLGANGAGKSTLVKILCGVYHASSGDVYIDGKKEHIGSPNDARRLGIGIVHQELSIVPTLTVLQNFFLGREKEKGILLDERQMLSEYKRICEEFDFDIDPRVQAKRLSVAKRQMIEIMKILSQDVQIIVLDEPTTSLTEEEKRGLFALIDKLKASGKTIVYISHILEEIFRLADTATIMRNGEVVGDFQVKELTASLISEYMTGIKIVHNNHESWARYKDKPMLEIKNYKSSRVNDVSFEIYPGEVLGFAGLVGAGRSEIVRAIFGADKHTGGGAFVDGSIIKIKTPKDAIKAGIGLIPEDRKNEGLILKHEIYKNMTLVQLKKFRRHKLLNAAMEKDYTNDVRERLSIKLGNIKAPVSSLSGGNQQKVVIGKWLSKDFKILIFDEPTKGVDVGAKEDIFSIIGDFAKAGTSIIFISSDLEEVIRVSDRIAVVKDGRIIKLMENAGIDQKDIMETILQG